MMSCLKVWTGNRRWIMLVLAAFAGAGTCCAQPMTVLPESPGAMLMASGSTLTAVQNELPTEPVRQAAAGEGAIAGSVVDADQAEIGAVKVTLESAGPHPTVVRVATSDGEGSFVFNAVPAGEYRLTFEIAGFQTLIKSTTVLAGLEDTVTGIVMAAGSEQEVRVTLTEHDLAQAELKVEEKQRLAGFYPNFYVSYDWKAAALSSRQKFSLALKSEIDPANFAVTAGIAGIQQGAGAFSGWEGGASGYGKRFAADYGDGLIGTLLGGAVLPSLLRQDPRYFYLGHGSIHRRALYAASAGLITRGDNGRWQPNYSSLLGNLGSGAISNLYYPASDRDGPTLTFENALIGILAEGVGGLVQEFAFKHITPHAATYAQQAATSAGH